MNIFLCNNMPTHSSINRQWSTQIIQSKNQGQQHEDKQNFENMSKCKKMLFNNYSNRKKNKMGRPPKRPLNMAQDSTQPIHGERANVLKKPRVQGKNAKMVFFKLQLLGRGALVACGLLEISRFCIEMLLNVIGSYVDALDTSLGVIVGSPKTRCWTIA